MIWILLFIGLAIVGIMILKHMYNEALIDDVKMHTFEYSNLPAQLNGLKIFFITDIHRRKISNTIIDKVKGKVDLVIIGGDLAEKGVEITQISSNLHQLNTVAPIIFIWGNNDYELDQNEFTQILAKHHVTMLKNQTMQIFDNQVEIIGLDDYTQEYPLLEPLFKNRNVFQLLLCHNPATLQLIPEENEISLALCGHTHGGQIRIFGFGPYSLGGIRKIREITTLTSNGYGTSMLPLRLGAKPETHIITFTCGK